VSRTIDIVSARAATTTMRLILTVTPFGFVAVRTR